MRGLHLAPLWFVLACGDNTQGAAPDAGAPTPDGATGFVEAPHDHVPQVVSGGGSVLAAPHVVPIFFASDSAMQAQVEPFLNALAASSYWPTTTSEYGVGALTIDTTIITSDAPPTSDTALASWIAAQADGTHGWPVPDANTIYAVYLPAGVVLNTPFGKSCQAFGGYHDETMGPHGESIVYALMPRCGGGIDGLSAVTSHELVEAVTDPHPFTNTGFANLDPEHGVWALAPGGELGDMCEYVGQAEQRLVGSYVVQRTWSNASAAAGHDPCVPLMDMPYASAAPVLTDDDMVDPMDGTPLLPTKGIKIPVGMSKTIEIDLFSDAPTSDWMVKAIDAALLTGSTAELTFAWDRQTGNNGDKLQLTITRTKAGQGGSEFLISSRPGGVSDSIWWGFVAN